MRKDDGTGDLFSSVPSREQAKAKRDVGIAAAGRNAGFTWQDTALFWVGQFARSSKGPFMAEDVREHAEASGLPKPPDGRAWGVVMQAARRKGMIFPDGYAPARSSNLSPKVRWRA